MTQKLTRELPVRLSIGGQDLTIKKLEASDFDGVEAFIKTLPNEDLLYTRRDLTNEKVRQAWFDADERGDMDSLLAISDGQVVASASIVRDPLSWSPHVAELRVMVGPTVRRIGLGRRLIEECFLRAIAMGVEKLTAHMTIEQSGAVAIFEEMGFRGEALLRDHVKDAEGGLHDIAILSCNVDEASRRLASYGIEAVQ